MEDNTQMALHFHPFFEDSYKAIGDFVFIPREFRALKGTDKYQEEINKIAEALKGRLAEETKKYMTVVVRDGENDLNTVGIKIFIKIQEES